MKRFLLPALSALLTTALAAAPTLPQAPGGSSSSFVLRSGQPDLAWTICDAVNQPQVIVVGQPDAAGRTEVTTFSKAAAGAYSYQAFVLGQADPGAGQVYYSLTPRTGDAKAQPGNVHAVNPGMLDQPRQILTPPVTSVQLPGQAAAQCRWVPGLRALGFTARRSFTITQDANGRLTYQSFDDSAAPGVRVVQRGGVGATTTPSQTVTGGHARSTAGATTFTFTNDGFTYTVRLGNSGDGSLSVSRGGRTVQTERLNGYTLAVPR